jgi:hypothetical protein
MLKTKWKKNHKQRESAQAQHWGGMIDHFEKTFQRQKVRKQAQMILSLEIP